MGSILKVCEICRGWLKVTVLDLSQDGMYNWSVVWSFTPLWEPQKYKKSIKSYETEFIIQYL